MLHFYLPYLPIQHFHLQVCLYLLENLKIFNLLLYLFPQSLAFLEKLILFYLLVSLNFTLLSLFCLNFIIVIVIIYFPNFALVVKVFFSFLNLQSLFMFCHISVTYLLGDLFVFSNQLFL